MDWGMTEGITGLISVTLAVLSGAGWLCWFLFGLHADRKELQKDVDNLELKLAEQAKQSLEQSKQALLFSTSIHNHINELVIRLAGGKSE